MSYHVQFVLAMCVIPYGVDDTQANESVTAVHAPVKQHQLANGVTLIIQPKVDPRWTDDLLYLAEYHAGALTEPRVLPGISFALARAMINPGKRHLDASDDAAEEMPIVATVNQGTTLFFVQGRAVDLPVFFQVEADRLQLRETHLSDEGDMFVGPFWQVQVPPSSVALSMCNHAWRAGKPEISLELPKPSRLPGKEKSDYSQSVYCPYSLTLMIVGNVDEGAVVRLAKTHISPISKARPVQTEMPDLAKMPDLVWVHVTGQEDSGTYIVCAYPFPENDWDRLVLAIWGSVAREGMEANATIHKCAEEVFATEVSQYSSHKGGPFIVGAKMRSSASVAELRNAMNRFLADSTSEDKLHAELSRMNELYSTVCGIRKPENFEAETGRVVGLLALHHFGLDPQRAGRRPITLSDVTRALKSLREPNVQKTAVVALKRE